MDSRIFKGTVGVVKNQAKDSTVNSMVQAFGSDAHQIGSCTLAIKSGETENGTPVYVKVVVSSLEYEDRETTKKTFKAFDVAQAELDYQTEQSEKQARNEKSKTERIREKIARLQKQLDE